MYRVLMAFLFLIHITLVSAQGQPLVAVGKQGMVVSAQHLATQVGVDVLKKGGNAIDAAVAMGYALAVVDPCCGNIGGGGFMMIRPAKGETVVLNFREKAPASLKMEALVKKTSPYAVVGIPGTVKGLNAALERYGTLPLKDLIKPAIKLAEEGYVLQEQDMKWFKVVGPEVFNKEANTANIFLKDGKIYQIGDRLIQKNLSETLRLIGDQGTSAFYEGKIADEIVQASEKHHGFITKQDLAQYSVTFEKPLTCQYRGKSLLVTPPPSTGGITLCELLKVVEGFPLKSFGQYDSIQNLKTNIEAIRYVYQDKARYMGDPNFVKIPTQTLLSDVHTKNIQEKIKKGVPPRREESKKVPPTIGFEKSDTTSYVVADAKGNIAVVTYTLNGPFGAQVMPGETGFFLNSQLEDFSYGEDAELYMKEWGVNPNAPAPKKIPASSITQVMLLEKKKPILVLATPGGDTIPAQMLNTIENTVDFHKPIAEAVNAPRYFFRWMQDKVYLEPELHAKKKEIEALGYEVGNGSGCNENGGLPYCGGMTAIEINPKTHVYTGVVDKRRPSGKAEGY